MPTIHDQFNTGTFIILVLSIYDYLKHQYHT